jgi:hypothetical protein
MRGAKVNKAAVAVGVKALVMVIIFGDALLSCSVACCCQLRSEVRDILKGAAGEIESNESANEIPLENKRKVDNAIIIVAECRLLKMYISRQASSVVVSLLSKQKLQLDLRETGAALRINNWCVLGRNNSVGTCR